MSTLEAQAAAWSDYQGDDWSQVWTRDTGGRVYDADTLLVELRDADGVVVASSAESPPEGVLPIDITGSDLGGDPAVWSWAIAAADTAEIPASDGYVIAAKCEVDGLVDTFFAHDWECLARAVSDV